MKKILALILMLFLSFNASVAKNIDKASLNFNGAKYYLLYSAKSDKDDSYLNEYYKRGETYNIWTEMVGIHHFPNEISPLDRVRQFKDYLKGINCLSALTFDDKKNTAIIDFLLVNKIQGRTLLEFNVFKYERAKGYGSNAVQYAKRYVANNELEVERIKKIIEKSRKQTLNEVKGFKIPEIITVPIDKCKVENSFEEELTEEKTKIKNEIIDNTDVKPVEKLDEPIESLNKEEKEPEANNEEAVTVLTETKKEEKAEGIKPKNSEINKTEHKSEETKNEAVEPKAKSENPIVVDVPQKPKNTVKEEGKPKIEEPAKNTTEVYKKPEEQYFEPAHKKVSKAEKKVKEEKVKKPKEKKNIKEVAKDNNVKPAIEPKPTNLKETKQTSDKKPPKVSEDKVKQVKEIKQPKPDKDKIAPTKPKPVKEKIKEDKTANKEVNQVKKEQKAEKAKQQNKTEQAVKPKAEPQKTKVEKQPKQKEKSQKAEKQKIEKNKAEKPKIEKKKAEKPQKVAKPKKPKKLTPKQAAKLRAKEADLRLRESL